MFVQSATRFLSSQTHVSPQFAQLDARRGQKAPSYRKYGFDNCLTSACLPSINIISVSFWSVANSTHDWVVSDVKPTPTTETTRHHQKLTGAVPVNFGDDHFVMEKQLTARGRNRLAGTFVNWTIWKYRSHFKIERENVSALTFWCHHCGTSATSQQKYVVRCTWLLSLSLDLYFQDFPLR